MRSTRESILNVALILGCSAGAALISGCGASSSAATSNSAPVTTPDPVGNPTPTPTPPTPPPTPTPSAVPRSSHVVLVIEENHMFSEVYPSGMPWLVSQGNAYGYATNYHADEP